MKVNVNDLVWYGRNLDLEGKRFFDFSASGFEVCLKGTKCTCTVYSDSKEQNDTTKAVIGIYTKEIKSEKEYKAESFWENFEKESCKKIIFTENKTDVTLFESTEEKIVVIKVLKLSEVNFGSVAIDGLEIDGVQIKSPDGSEKIRNSKLKIEYIGDSITCGYGIEGVWNKDTFTTAQERADKSYAFKTVEKLGAEFEYCSWSGIGIISKYVDPSVELPDVEVVMPGIWPYTDKSLCMRKKIEPVVWDERNFSPDLVIVHLGTNDASFVRKVEERRIAFVSGYEQLLEAVHRRSPNAKILCCLGVMGQDLCDSVEEAVKRFKKNFASTDVISVKFPVQEEKDGIAADWHPSETTHEKVAVQLSEEIRKFMKL